jgi:YebC/PmpR family DNA-binding regulatory protein
LGVDADRRDPVRLTLAPAGAIAPPMAGHSKFANIMHRKGAQDKKRARMFTKLAREIQIAATIGGPEPGNNPRLFRAIAAARAQSMPKDNIQRAIDKAAGFGGADLVEVRYEGFGPGGVGVIVEAATDNRNRTAGELRAAFSKNGGNLGETNSVSFLWDKVGEIRFREAAAAEDAMLEAAIEAGADDCALEAGEEAREHVIVCAQAALSEAAQALAARFGDPLSAKFLWRPQTTVPVTGEAAQQLVKMIGAIDDLDDVQDVFANYEIDDAELAKLSG